MGQPAQSSHPGSEFYWYRWELHNWDGGVRHRVRLFTDSRTVCTNCESEARIKNAAARWNRDTSVTMFFKFVDNRQFPYDMQKRNQNINYIWQVATLNGDRLATTSATVYDNGWTLELWNTNVRFRADVDWWTQTSDPPDGFWDWYSVALHEITHVSGWGLGQEPPDDHFIHMAPAGCEHDVHHHTMCPHMISGERWLRSMEHHDLYTIQDAYEIYT